MRPFHTAISVSDTDEPHERYDAAMSERRDDDLWFVEVTAPLPSSRVQVVAAEASARLKLPTEKLVALLDNRVGPVTKPLPRASAERVAGVLDAAGVEVTLRQPDDAPSEVEANEPAPNPTPTPEAPVATDSIPSEPASASAPDLTDTETSTEPPAMDVEAAANDQAGEGTFASSETSGETPVAQVRDAVEAAPAADAPTLDTHDASTTPSTSKPASWTPPLLPEDAATRGDAGPTESTEGSESSQSTTPDAVAPVRLPERGRGDAATEKREDAPATAPDATTETSPPPPEAPTQGDDPWTRMVEASDEEDLGAWTTPTKAKDTPEPSQGEDVKTEPSASPAPRAHPGSDVEATNASAPSSEAAPTESASIPTAPASPSAAPPVDTPPSKAAPSTTAPTTPGPLGNTERSTGRPASTSPWMRSEPLEANDASRDEDDLWGGGMRDPFAEAERRERFIRRLVLGTALVIATGVFVALQLGFA